MRLFRNSIDDSSPLFDVTYILVWKVIFPLVRQSVLTALMLVRHDEHPLDTEEWLNQKLRIEPPDQEVVPEPEESETVPAEEPSLPLDVLHAATPQARFIRGIGWVAVVRTRADDADVPANDR